MARIATLITDLFNDTEYLQPARAFRKAGHQVVHIGLQSNNKVKGLNAQTSVLIDRGVTDAYAWEYGALFIPGGYSSDRLRENDAAVRLVREFMQIEKPVFVICHGLQLLISACMLAGRRVAGRKALAQDIANAGGILADRDVMIDSNLISCCGDVNLPVFILACLHQLATMRKKGEMEPGLRV
jgi:protease I